MGGLLRERSASHGHRGWRGIKPGGAPLTSADIIDYEYDTSSLQEAVHAEAALGFAKVSGRAGDAQSRVYPASIRRD